jgi:hypothetical protein
MLNGVGSQVTENNKPDRTPCDQAHSHQLGWQAYLQTTIRGSLAYIPCEQVQKGHPC